MAALPAWLEFDAITGVIGYTAIMIVIREQFPGSDGL